MTDQTKRLLVVVTAGPADVDKAIFALDAALVAAASGVAAEVFLTLDGAEWACERPHELETRVDEMLTQLQAMGVPVACCSTCASSHCSGEEEPATPHTCALHTHAAVRTGITMQGIATLVERVATGIPTVTF